MYTENTYTVLDKVAIKLLACAVFVLLIMDVDRAHGDTVLKFDKQCNTKVLAKYKKIQVQAIKNGEDDFFIELVIKKMEKTCANKK